MAIQHFALTAALKINKMKNRSNSLGFAIFVLGIILIFVGFYVTIPFEKWNNVIWLNAIVLSLVYLFSYVNIFGLLGIYFDFNEQIAGLGIRLIFIRLYRILAIGSIIICAYNDVEFRYQLYLQLLLVFFLLITILFTRISTENAVAVEIEQNELRKNANEILKVVKQFEILFIKDPSNWKIEKEKIAILKEHVRYITPSNNQSAIQIDAEIVKEINRAFDLANNKNQYGTEVISILARCIELLNLRKNIYSN